jgi:hypothetical protein
MGTEHATGDGCESGVKPNPIEVDWDGPKDPQNPWNWSFALRYGQVATVSALTLLT